MIPGADTPKPSDDVPPIRVRPKGDRADDGTLASGSNTPSLYAGLSPGHRMAIVISALAIVVLNMIFGAYVMFASTGHMAFGPPDQQTVAQFSGGIADAGASALLRAKSIDAVANIKLIANKQAIIIVAFAGAFSLIAIGFALFVLGADGAFKAEASAPPGAHAGKLLLTGTAPGLFCFACAVALIASGIFHRSELRLGETNISGPADTTEGAAPAASPFQPDGGLKGAGK
jgi:hypothetical protein